MVIEDFPEPCPPLKPNIIVFLFLIIEEKYNVRGKRIFEKYYDDLISLNNFLCILHESVSKTAPFKLSSKKA